MAAVIESLEDRRLLTTLYGGDVFDYQQASGQQVRIDVQGNTVVEVVGAVVDDRNNVLLTDVPGHLFTAANGRTGLNLLGGISGLRGLELIGPTGTTDPGYGPGNIGAPDGTRTPTELNFGAIASRANGDTFGFNYGEVTILNQPTRKLIQLAKLNTGTGAGTVTAMIQEASLQEDVGAALSQLLPNIGDVAYDPTTDRIYAINEENGQSILYGVNRLTGLVQRVGPITNQTTSNPLSDVQAMAFDSSGQMYILTRDYDGNPNVDADGLLISNDPITNPTPPPDTLPNTSPLDVALVKVNKAIASFTNANVQSILLPDPTTGRNFATIDRYTAMMFDTNGTILAAAEDLSPQTQAGGGGGGGAQQNPWQLHRITLNPAATSLVAANLGEIQVGGVTRIDGMAPAVNIFGQPFIVGLDNGTADANGAIQPRLVRVNPVNPNASTSLSQIGSIIRGARGLTSIVEPGDTRPLLYTLSRSNVIRGSAVSLEVAPDGGATVVNSVLAADFDPISGLLYFVADQAGAIVMGSVLHTVNVNATTNGVINRSAIQNSLTQALGSFNVYPNSTTGAAVSSIAFDQTGPNAATLVGVDGTTGRLLTVNRNNTNASGVSLPILLDCSAITGFTGLAYFGDDPNGRDPFIYATTATSLYRIRLGGVVPTAVYWGNLPDPDVTLAPIPGADIQGLTWNPLLVDPFTGTPGALIGTDATTDALYYIDHRLRAPATSIFMLYVAQADETSVISIGSVASDIVPMTGPGQRPMTPFTGDIGTIRVRNVNPPPQPIDIAAPGGSGAVLLGAKTKHIDCANAGAQDDLRPLTIANPLGPTGVLTQPFGVVPIGAGVGKDPSGQFLAGVFVTPTIQQAIITGLPPAINLLGSNLDLIQAMSVADDGTIVVIDGDRRNLAGAVIPSDQLALVNPGSGVANSVVNVLNANGGGALTGIQGLDWGDPANTGTQRLFAVYPIAGVSTLGAIDATPGSPTYGRFTAIATVGGGLALRAIAFAPDGRLFAVDVSSNLIQLNPSTGAIIKTVGPVIDFATGATLNINSMDFDADGTLFAQDQDNARLLDIEITTGLAGGNTSTTMGSLRASVGAISFDPTTNGFRAADNYTGAYGLGRFGEGRATESSALTSLLGTQNSSVRLQNFGRLLFDGTIMGHVDMEGSVELFYAGWLLTGATAGQGLTAPSQPNNFRIAGDLRNLILTDSAGTNSALLFDALNYNTGFAISVGGKIDEILSRHDFVGSVDVENSGSGIGALGAPQRELESRTGAPGTVDGAGFENGLLANIPLITNDTYDTPQYLATITSAGGGQMVDVLGGLRANPVILDYVDYYAVALLAGQTITVTLTDLSLFPGLLHVGVFDPDRRLIASDNSDQDPTDVQYHPFQFTTDRPGSYRFAVATLPDGDFDGSAATGDFGITNSPLPLSYELQISGAGDIALGGLVASGEIYDGRLSGTQIHVQTGDVGGIVAGDTIGSSSIADALDEDSFAASQLAPEDALTGATIDATNGNVRDIEAQSIGRKRGGSLTAGFGFDLGVDFDAFNGSVGLIRSTGTRATDMLVINDDIGLFGPPRTSDHDPDGTARQVAIKGDYQVVSSATTLYANLLANKGIGTVRADDMATTVPSFFVVNADQTGRDSNAAGRDGIFDLLDVNTQLGTLNAGGPAIITGPGGNMRYIHLPGVAFRDQYFGSGIPEPTVLDPGQSAVIHDDSGTEVDITPGPAIPGAPQNQQPQVRITTYGIRGSGGSAIIGINASQSVVIRGKATASTAAAEIGLITIAGNGPGFTIDEANRRLIPPGAGIPPVFVQIDGTAIVDALDIRGNNVTSIINNSRGGEIVNVTVNSLFQLTGQTLGLARHSTPAVLLPANPLIEGLTFHTMSGGGFPFDNPHLGIVALGDFGVVKASQALGNIIATGSIFQLIADSNNKRAAGSFEGIVAPVVAVDRIYDVTVGAGIAPSGTGNAPQAGLFAGNAIGNIHGKDAVIYGNIVVAALNPARGFPVGTPLPGQVVPAPVQIERINLTGNSAIVDANIEALTSLAASREFETIFPHPTIQIFGNVGDIFVDGAAAQRGKPAPQDGGIIGTLVAGNNIGTMRVRNGFGIINSSFYLLGNGTVKDFLADGYGVRDVLIEGGASIGRIIATGKGDQLPATGFISAVRQSETSVFNPITHGENNRLVDLHNYLQTSATTPTLPDPAADPTGSVTRAGVIAGLDARGSRDLTLVDAWRVGPSSQIVLPLGPAYVPSQFHLANSIKNFNVRKDAVDLQITTGRFDNLTITGNSIGSGITVAGIFSNLRIGGNYVLDTIPSDLDIIQAIGPDGEIKNIFIGGNMAGTITAIRKIGKVTVKGNFTGKVFQNGIQVAP
jgi:uncharacterized protein (DUF2141 family)